MAALYPSGRGFDQRPLESPAGGGSLSGAIAAMLTMI
jgi:hypothetical protein